MARAIASPAILPPQSSPLQVPSGALIEFLERWAPGAWRDYVGRLVAGLRSIDAAALGQLSITSWYRHPEHNRKVGGSRDSQHQIGLGIDFAGSPSAQQAVAAAMRRQGLVVVDEGDHVHVQAWPAGVARSSGMLGALLL